MYRICLQYIIDDHCSENILIQYCNGITSTALDLLVGQWKVHPVCEAEKSWFSTQQFPNDVAILNF